MKARGGMANGVFGCAVVGIIILASLGLAFLGNAENRDVDTTNWSYVTSANPAFSYDQAPARVDYSPPANYTGYTTDNAKSEFISGVTYTPTPAPNSYMVKTAPTTAATGTVTYQQLINNSLGYIPGLNTVSFTNNHVFLIGAASGYYSPAAISPLTDIFSSLEGAASITISATSEITLTGSSNVYFIVSTDDTPTFINGSARYYEYSLFGDKLVISTVGSTAQLYKNGELLGTYSLDNLRLASIINFQPPGNVPDVLAESLDYTVKSWTAGYMNPSYGVTTTDSIASYSELSHVAPGDTVYSGAVLDGDAALDYAFSLGNSGPYNQSVYLKVYKGSTITVTRGEYPDPNSPANYVIEDYTTTLNTAGTTTINLSVTDDEIAADWADFNIIVTVVNEENPAPTVQWFNGYDNAAVNVLIRAFEGTTSINNISIACASSSWTVGGVAVGAWPAVLVTFDMDAGVSAAPVASFDNFMSYELAGESVTVNTTTTAPIGKLEISRDSPINMAVVSTTVYLAGGGVYRVDSTLNVAAKFPTYSTYNITISGAPHWGDSITINGTACAVDKDAGTVEISGVAFPLSGLVLAYSDSTFYYRGAQYEAGHLVAINGDLAADLGAAAGLVLKFDGTWYYETQLYSGEHGTITVVDWTPGVLGLDASGLAAVFTLLSLVGLVLASRLGGGTWDYLVLGSATLIGFIMCGVFI